MKKKTSLAVMTLILLIIVGCILAKPVLGMTSEASQLVSDLIPLAVDAEILDIRQNPSKTGLEVDYVSGNNIDTLADFYKGALKDSENLRADKFPSGYMITANLGKLHYMIMLSENAMASNPKYKGLVSVSIILSGLSAEPEKTENPEEIGETWPAAELAGLPQLEGQITQIQREDGVVRVRMLVTGVDVVKEYLEQLRLAGFRFDAEPAFSADDHLEFVAFMDSVILNFTYKSVEKAVFFEYMQ